MKCERLETGEVRVAVESIAGQGGRGPDRKYDLTMHDIFRGADQASRAGNELQLLQCIAAWEATSPRAKVATEWGRDMLVASRANCTMVFNGDGEVTRRQAAAMLIWAGVRDLKGAVPVEEIAALLVNVGHNLERFGVLVILRDTWRPTGDCLADFERLCVAPGGKVQGGRLSAALAAAEALPAFGRSGGVPRAGALRVCPEEDAQVKAAVRGMARWKGLREAWAGAVLRAPRRKPAK